MCSLAKGVSTIRFEKKNDKTESDKIKTNPKTIN